MGLQRQRLLVIDDDEDFRALVSTLLRTEYIVSGCAEGCEGFSRAISVRPDVVLLDVEMQGWDGVRTLKAFREHPKLRDLPIVMLTADNTKGTALAAAQAGADGYLLKSSCTKQELLDRLEPFMREPV